MKDCILINGGKKLEGRTAVQGSKNAGLPLIASAVAVGGKQVINNIPNISDIHDFLKILSFYGVKYEFDNNKLMIDSTFINHPTEEDFKKIVSYSLKIRSSTYILGAFLGRLKYLKLAKSGGCKLGTRPIDIHLKGVEELGGSVSVSEEYYEITLKKVIGRNIKFRYPSVGATINLILLSLYSDKDVIIENVAKEPEVDTVIDFLNTVGKKVSRYENSIKISHSEFLREVEFYNPFDRIVLGDLILATASTGGEIEIYNVNSHIIMALIGKIAKTSCNFDIKNDIIKYKGMGKLGGVVKTSPYPLFPTDLQAQFTASVCATGGRAVIREKVFGSRFEYANQLKLMGANLHIGNRTLWVYKSVLHAGMLTAPDLRGGAALVIAGLATPGYTKVSNLHIIDRGYEDIARVYNNLGAELKRIE